MTVKLRTMSILRAGSPDDLTREGHSERGFPTNEQLLSPLGDNASILNWPGKSWYPMPIFRCRPSMIPVPCSVQEHLHFLPCLVLDVPLWGPIYIKAQVQTPSNPVPRGDPGRLPKFWSLSGQMQPHPEKTSPQTQSAVTSDLI